MSHRRLNESSPGVRCWSSVVAVVPVGHLHRYVVLLLGESGAFTIQQYLNMQTKTHVYST